MTASFATSITKSKYYCAAVHCKIIRQVLSSQRQSDHEIGHPQTSLTHTTWSPGLTPSPNLRIASPGTGGVEQFDAQMMPSR
jgi:hypothetical protein